LELEAGYGTIYEVDSFGNWIPKPEPRAPSWLRRLLGDYFFTNVVEVDLDGTQVGDAILGELQGLTRSRL